ncbi:MAG: penicillin-binding protein 2 [Acidimicrobiia bacterium]|nr:penicillin-binding protein 2 [Acidimicrobiia bacterium]
MTSTRATARAAKRRTTFRRTTKPTDPRNRLIALLVVFVIIGAGFVAVLVDLQTVRPDRYRSLGEDQRTRTRQIAGYRGAVTDRNGFVLAASTPSHQIVADPTMVADGGVTAELLAPILGVDTATLSELLTPASENDRFSLLARNVDDEAVSDIQQLESATDDGLDPLVGIFVLPEEDRVYPAGELANAVVGRVDPDEQGIFGVEAQYNEVMTGSPGTEQFERGRFGSISVGDWKVDPATAGHDVVLTLDNRLQFIAEQTLIEHCTTSGADGATAVMSEPGTGELLVVASVVRNDEGDCAVAGYNTALLDTYELGSVMKPLVVAAATEELGFTADTTIEVPNRITVGGKGFADHPSHPAAPFPISEILASSMNVGTILISQRIPAETLHGYLDRFGLGHQTGLGVDGESSGVLRHPDDWWGADYGSIPIGQGVTMNATQLLAAYNVLANGGRFVPPVLVRSVEATDGEIQSTVVPDPTVVVSPRTADELTRSLVAVVAEGTGRTAAVSGYAVAGKTGTAWKVFDDGSGQLGYGSPGNRRYVVTFVGYLPAEDPKLSLAVVVDEPDGEVTASAIAAPIFSEIAGYAVRVLAIPPNGSPAPGSEGERVRGTPAGPALARAPGLAADGGVGQ